MSEGDRRRAQILEILKKSEQPVSGTDLAGRLHVSRQVIVQDVALLRAENREILSTYKGYVLPSAEKQSSCVRVFRVNHTTEETLDELQTMVDLWRYCSGCICGTSTLWADPGGLNGA